MPSLRPRASSWLALLLACLLTIVLTSCGGSSSPTHSAQPQNWNYVALGDSIAFGILAQEGYVPLYAQMMQNDTGNKVNTADLGVLGWKSADLLDALRNNDAMRSAVRSAQVVTWDVGGNDLLHARTLYGRDECGGADNLQCLRDTVSSFDANWDAIVAEILSLRGSNNTILRTMDVYNPFAGEDQLSGAFAATDPFLEQIDQHIHDSAAANGIPVAEVHRAFNGSTGAEDPMAKGYLAPDHVHPNDAGHRVIAKEFEKLGYAPLD